MKVHRCPARRPAHRLVPGLCLIFLSLLVAAEGPAWGQGPRIASYQLQWENDAFNPVGGTDREYTNGIRLSFLLEEDSPNWLEELGFQWCAKTKLCGHDELGEAVNANAVNWGFGLGQLMYTPERLDVSQLIPTDRPYAGYLFGSMLVYLRSDTHPNLDIEKNQPTQNYFEIQVGLVGPASGAEWAQTELHEIIDSQEPLGWDNQLPNEPVVQLVYQWRRKIGNDRRDVIPNWGGAFGTAAIYANAGFKARYGLNLSDFPVPIQAPTAVPVDLKISKWEAHVFLGVNARLVAHNIFLDGTVFRESHSVDKENFVYDLEAGFVARYKKCQLSYTWVRRSKEFSPAFDGDGRHEFASVALTRFVKWPGTNR